MIVPFESAVKRFHSKDHAVTALTSPRHAGKMITRSALHHYQGRNCDIECSREGVQIGVHQSLQSLSWYATPTLRHPPPMHPNATPPLDLLV